MSDHYVDNARKYLDYTSFTEFFQVFIDSQLRIAAAGKINCCEVNIILPEGLTKEIIFNLEKLTLTEIQKINPLFHWESRIATYDLQKDVYYLALYNIFC